ncbi:MAG: IS66 family transposase [Chryseobacterium sp.]
MKKENSKKLENIPAEIFYRKFDQEKLEFLSKKDVIQLLMGTQDLFLKTSDLLDKELQLKIQINQKHARLVALHFGAIARKKREKPAEVVKRRSGEKPAIREKGTLSERHPNLEIKTTVVPFSSVPTCPCCLKEMRPTGLTKKSEVLRIEPKKYFIELILRDVYGCKCYSSLETAPLPARIVPGSIYGDDVIIDLAVSKYFELIPIGRLAKISLLAGFDFKPNSMIECTHYLASFLEIIYEMLKEEVLGNKNIKADETTHRMLEGDERRTWYLWVFMSKYSAYYEAHGSRSGDVATNLLLNSNCETILTDVFSGYGKSVKVVNKERTRLGIQLLENPNCNAHAQVKFKNCESNYKEEYDFYCGKYKKIFELEREAKNENDNENVLEVRKKMIPLFEEMKSRAEIERNEVLPKSDIGIAINYFYKNYDGLTLFLSRAEIDIDNNSTERRMKSPAIGRKTWLGTHSKKGAQTMAIMFSLVESCKVNNVDPRKYLKAIVSSLHRHTGKWKKSEEFNSDKLNIEWIEANSARQKFAFTPKTYREWIEKEKMSNCPQHSP